MLFFNLNFRFLYRNLKYCGYMYLQYFVCLRTKAKSILLGVSIYAFGTMQNLMVSETLSFMHLF